MMLHHNQYKFLFTGDLNHKIGSYLAKSATEISADILKVPHHGTETVAPNNFFQKVSPKYGLVPAPEYLWLSDRSKRVRNWFLQNNIPVYVSGISGDVRVAVNGNTLTINAEKDL
jgi:competence protein ComEC